MTTRDVYIWSTFLNPHPSRMSELLEVLTPEERDRAGAFNFADGRDRFIAARALLRRVLGSIIGLNPRDVLITTGRNGKPMLGRDGEHSAIDFNVSHSETRVLLTVARGRSVGIDLEKINPSVECEQLAHDFFHIDERDELLRVPSHLRRDAFFAIWSCKEAYLKATGDGLGRPLQDFCISGVPAGTPRLKAVHWDAAECQRWTFRSIAIPGHAAAVVAEGSDWQPILLESDSYDTIALSVPAASTPPVSKK